MSSQYQEGDPVFHQQCHIIQPELELLSVNKISVDRKTDLFFLKLGIKKTIKSIAAYKWT